MEDPQRPHARHINTRNQIMKIQPDWICGFVDGEGSFFISFEKKPKMTLGLQVRIGFKVTQHFKNVQVLHGSFAAFFEMHFKNML